MEGLISQVRVVDYRFFGESHNIPWVVLLKYEGFAIVGFGN
jgi:hypothetical protein